MIRTTALGITIGLLVGAGHTHWLYRDARQAERNLITTQGELATERSRAAQLRGSLRSAEAQIVVAEAAARELQQVNEQDRARLLSLEELIDGIQATEGADRPVTGALRDALRLPSE